MNINAVISAGRLCAACQSAAVRHVDGRGGRKIPASKHRVTAVTLNFRDPDYSVERGGYHPVEIRLVHPGDEWCLDYRFWLYGNVYPESRKSSISAGLGLCLALPVQGFVPV